MNDEIITIEEARLRGLRWYFTGNACPRGHVAKRSLSNRDCRACVEARSAEKDRLDPTRAKNRNARRYHKDVEASRSKIRASRKKHIEKRRKDERDRYTLNSERKTAQKNQAAEWAKANSKKRVSINKKYRGKKRLNAEYDSFLANLESAQGNHNAE